MSEQALRRGHLIVAGNRHNHDGDTEQTAIGVIADLMHVCREAGLDPFAVVDVAVKIYEYEAQISYA